MSDPEQLRHHFLENLLHKLQQAFSTTPLDLDYLEFLCRQEMYILEALSSHIQVPPAITQALQELFDLIRAQVERPAPWPLSLVHVDTNHKLIRYNIVIFGGVDGFSRKILYLNAATNNRASTAFSFFLEATHRHGLPLRVRADQGVENVDIARFMFTVCGNNRGSFISGKSIHNQRIERLWRDVWISVSSKYYNLLHSLEEDGLLDISCTDDIFCVHFAFLPRLKRDLEVFIEAWNHHPLRTERNRSPTQIWEIARMLNTTVDSDNPEKVVLSYPNMRAL
ncbi:hypothetical protein QQF64_023852 [Cirrhinus molitorella]|uniref:Integrase catalytic domain-containing protein n=1 Tax=Cirrhinus molitorella TaxID=172907 RepID=A0ABR3NJU1_9TELE